MSLSITSLNSGSNGNCYYIGNDQEAVLVDVGISCRETERRMARLGLSMHKVKAIFVSHEHSDHIRGIPVLARKYKLPVYITPFTQLNSRLSYEGVTVLPFVGYEPVWVGSLCVRPFPKLHDAADPHSFVVSGEGVNIGVFTDIGSPCQHVIQHFQECHAAFLEANYDDALLDKGRYPYHLKQRIRGGRGHLSNKQAITLFTGYKPDHMSHVLLAHLSKDNNCPNLVKELFTAHAAGTEVVVASRFVETPVYTIHAATGINLRPITRPVIPEQLKLAF
ncbi:MBL fold metallo-hydrolase [Pontibacter sp. E15-1]|uniref:MBL fold metallo-hydrolase n=1 Tax=Pontibacter sp. E15-1 TaxID=2919918 RepID=UPI001F4FDBDE|nr:MBL fold metallo-hydrolase [Pontibacter sp. E15-1]MCJ8167409.1 MBL fold metallo-hydrolase [Pontibacter sp. E15-1]